MKDHVRISFHIKEKEVDHSFIEQDIYSLMDEGDDKLITISSLMLDKEYRNNGIGTERLQSLIEEYKDWTIIASTGIFKSEFPNKPSIEEVNKILEEQDRFMIKNGFVNINDFIGYESKEAYIYNNDKGKKILRKIYKKMNDKLINNEVSCDKAGKGQPR